MIATLLIILAAVMGGGESRIEGKVSYYYPTNAVFRETYGSGGPLYGLEFSTQVYKMLYPWVNLGYFTQSGSTPSDHYHTSVDFYPVSIGLKYLFPLFYYPDGCCAKSPAYIYLGAGILGEFLRIKNDAPYAADARNKWGIGGSFKSGILIDIKSHVYVDLFIDYSYMEISFSKEHNPLSVGHVANTSGLSAGLGIGGRF